MTKWLTTIIDRVVREADPVRLILFGSQARGDAKPDSDVDLLVVLTEVTDKRRAAIALRRVLADLPISKDIIVTTPEEIACRGHLVGSVLRAALREGRVIYEQDRAL